MRSLVLVMILAGTAAAQQATDVIRGRVTGPDSLPVEGANVRATSYAGGVVKATRTDARGRFTIVFINGEGDYWLDFYKIGLAPRRFEVKKIGDEEVIIADARMVSTIATLDAANIIGSPNRALPNRHAQADVGGGDRPLTNAAVTPDAAGNIAAMAAGVPGIQFIPGLDGAADMYSLLGLSGDQNNTTFNGLGSGINILPPDILAYTSIRPFPFDVSIGGFSGAQASIQTIPGSNFSRRVVNSVNIAPSLEWADDVAERQGQKYTSARIGGNAAGPIAMNKTFYNGAYNFNRRFNDVQSLLAGDAFGLASAGVSADSAARLLSILSAKGVPSSVAGLPALQVQNGVQALLNVDFMPSASGAGHSFTLGLAGNYQGTQPAATRGNLLLSTPAHNGEAAFWGLNAALVHSNYFWFGVLEKTTIGFAESGSSAEPYLPLPQGSVLVTSGFPDGTSAVKSLFFGGNPLLSEGNTRTAQLTNQLSWYSADNSHTIKLASGLSLDAFTNDVSANLRGSFAFNSLADLEAGKPNSFSRTLARNAQSGRQLTGTLSLGDYWRPVPEVQVQYGVRMDANRFLDAPAFNRAVLDTFGARNDAAPDGVYFSPRIGVQWYYGKAPQVSYAPGAVRLPRAVVHAGVGAFQNLRPAQLVGPAVNATGLANSTRTISCVGTAVPFPAWESFLANEANIPAQCADGSAGTVFATAAPGVTLFGAGFRQPRSLRSAADWSSPVLDNRFVIGVQGIISFGSHQQGQIDLNMKPEPGFILSTEGGRPVFAPASAIVTTTGAIASAATRVSPSFQRVMQQRSELRIESRQVSVNLKPVTASPYLRWDLTYTVLDAREEYYGFASTAGNPFEKRSGRVLQGGQHTITLAWNDFPVFDLAYLTLNARIMSGSKFTPMVAGDVNGDGMANDRAFIFDPDVPASPTASSLRALLDASSRRTGDCLLAQIGRLAGRGSCQGPWTTLTGLQVKFNPRKIGLPKRTSLSFTVANPLAIADLMLHGSNDLRGWGQLIPPDQNLLFVRGFDANARRFTYDVNQRFGSTRPQQSATRALPYMSLSVGFDIGSPRERQMLTQRLDIGRAQEGTKQSAAALTLLGTQAIPNPMAMLMQQQDSLHLTRKQADSLATLSRRFAVYVDSVWWPVARYLEKLPDQYSGARAYGRYVDARERTVDFLLSMVDDAKGVLTSRQRRQLPPQIANYLDRRVLRFLRSSTLGDASGVIVK